MTVLFISDLHLTAGDAETIASVHRLHRRARAQRTRAVHPRRSVRGLDRRRRRRPAHRADRRRAREADGLGCAVRADARQSRLPVRPAVLRYDGLPSARRLRTVDAVRPTRAPDARRPALHRRHALHDAACRAALPGLATRLPRQNARRAPPDRERPAAAVRNRDRDQERLHHGRQSGDRRKYDARPTASALLLHGHTHRPAVHRFELAGQPAARIVLGAWYEQASIVRWTAAGFALETLD